MNERMPGFSSDTKRNQRGNMSLIIISHIVADRANSLGAYHWPCGRINRT